MAFVLGCSVASIAIGGACAFVNLRTVIQRNHDPSSFPYSDKDGCSTVEHHLQFSNKPPKASVLACSIGGLLLVVGHVAFDAHEHQSILGVINGNLLDIISWVGGPFHTCIESELSATLLKHSCHRYSLYCKRPA